MLDMVVDRQSIGKNALITYLVLHGENSHETVNFLTHAQNCQILNKYFQAKAVKKNGKYD